MADFTALKSAIQTYIKQNGNEEITGEKLQEILLSVVTTLGDSAINDLVTALNNEVTARQNADGTLQQNITNEATARGNADTALGGRIDDEATARANGDSALSNRLGSTITAENTAAEQIAAEATARAAADTALQDLIDGITENIENGYVYAGIATPSSTPATGKVFYLALTAGTYTNFGNTIVSQGINILKYNGSAWSLDAFIGIDDTPTPNSPKLVKSGGAFESVMANGSAFDISAHFASGGTLATYANLTTALTALDTLSADYKRGGMSIKFVQSSDNKYVQYFLTKNQWSANEADWEKYISEEEEVNAIFSKTGWVYNIPISVTQGTSISNDVEYKLQLKAGQVIVKLIDSDNLLSGNLAIYKYVNGVRTYWRDLTETDKEVTISDDIEGVSFYADGSSVVGTGVIIFEAKQKGIFDTEINNIRDIAERKVERLAWIGPSSAGHTWAVGEKMYNTTLNDLATCISVSPVNFADGHAPSQESLYLYDGTLYEWDGTSMKEVDSIAELQLREDAENSLERYYSYRDYVVGGLYNGQIVTDDYAIVTKDIHTAYTDMIFSVKDGYRYNIHFYNGTIYSSKTGWVTKDTKIDKGTNFRVAIASVGGDVVAETITFARQISFKFVNFLNNTTQLKIFGKYSEEYKSTQGTDIEGITLWNPYCMRIKIANGNAFKISLSGTITSGITFYAFAVDGTRQSINKNTFGYYIAPFDMVGIGVYIVGSSVTSTGTYTITVEDISIDEIKDSVYGQGVLPYWGKKAPSLSIFSRTNRCKEEVLISENNTNEGNDNRWAAGLVVYGNRIFSFNDGNYCMVFDKTTLTLLEKATLPWSSHNNNAQPTPYFYDEGDDFPLFLVSRGDYANQGEQKFYFVRVVENNSSFTFTIVKTVSYSDFVGEQYNCSWFANYEKNELFCYTYPNGSWDVQVDNPNVIHKFRMPSMDNYNDVTLTGNDIISTVTMLDHWITQSCLYHDNKIYMQASRELNDTGITINGEPYDKSKGVCFLFIIDPDSGYIETLVPLYNYIEQEGMCICDGALYMSEKHSLAAAGSLCFRIMRYTFN